MKKFYFKHLALVLILGVFVLSCIFFLGKFQDYTRLKSNGSSLGRYSKATHDKPLQITSSKQFMFFSINSDDLDHKNLRSILHQLMDQHFHIRGNNLPLNQESIDWMSRLPVDHAISMLQILSHVPPVDWQEQVVSLRNLPDYEQKRALKINRYNNNVYECSDPTECRD